MNRILYGLVAGVVSVCTATAAQQRRREDQPMAEEAVTSWDSPKLLRIKEDWRALWETYLKTPEKLPADRSNSYEKVKEMQGHLFRTSLSDKEARNLAASCGSLPVRCKDWSEPDNAVVAFMVEAFVYSRDRESLVRLFSTRFPLWIGNWPTEYYLAMAAEGRLKDAILVLGEAYSKSRVPEVRTHIGAVVRRAFANLGIRGKDDAEFVTNAMKWFEREKGRDTWMVAIGTATTPSPWNRRSGLQAFTRKPGVTDHRSLLRAPPPHGRKVAMSNRTRPVPNLRKRSWTGRPRATRAPPKAKRTWPSWKEPGRWSDSWVFWGRRRRREFGGCDTSFTRACLR